MSYFKENYPVSDEVYQKYYLGQNISAKNSDSSKTSYFDDLSKHESTSITRRICKFLHRVFVRKETVVTVNGTKSGKRTIYFLSEDGLQWKSFFSAYLFLCFKENDFLNIKVSDYNSVMVRVLSKFSSKTSRLELFNPLLQVCTTNIENENQVCSCWAIESVNQIQVQISLLEDPQIHEDRLDPDQWCWITFDRVESEPRDLQVSCAIEGNGRQIK